VWDTKAHREHFHYAHAGAVTGLQFHPHEYAMASSGMDKVVKFVDLDSVASITSSPPEATGVRAMAFEGSGKYLFAATGDLLKVGGGVRAWGLGAAGPLAAPGCGEPAPGCPAASRAGGPSAPRPAPASLG
jgi:hypothetical protein